MPTARALLFKGGAGLAPASSKASRSKGLLLGGGEGANTRLGLGVGVKSEVLIRAVYRNRPDFRPADRLAEGPGTLWATRTFGRPNVQS